MFKATGSHGLGIGELASSMSCHSDLGEYVMKAKQVMAGDELGEGASCQELQMQILHILLCVLL